MEGEYSLFTIYAKTDDPPYTYLAPDKIVTILHEYLHFIQDVSTTFGLAFLNYRLSRIANFYNIQDKQIKLPYIFHDPDTAAYDETNANLFTCYFNNARFTPFPNLEHLGIIPKIKIQTDFADSSYFYGKCSEGVPYFSVEIENKGTYEFGAQAIMEGMCQIFENHITNAQRTVWRIPYDLPELILLNELPHIAKNKAYMFAMWRCIIAIFSSCSVIFRNNKNDERRKFYSL